MTGSVLDLFLSCFKVSFLFLHINFLFLLIRFLPLFYSHEHTSHASKLSGISTSRLSLVLLPFSCTGSVSVFKFECQSFFMEKELKWPRSTLGCVYGMWASDRITSHLILRVFLENLKVETQPKTIHI